MAVIAVSDEPRSFDNRDPEDVAFKLSNRVTTKEEVPQLTDNDCDDLYRWVDDGGRNIDW